MPAVRHPRVDLDRWLAEFSEADAPADGTAISGPRDLVRVERARRAVRGAADLGDPLAVDFILWSADPPAAPHLTRLGGVPHREAAAAWPANAKGEPLTFVGQFCFLDSEDIAAAPRGGDVLLIFFDGEYGWADPPAGIDTEWSNVELKDPLTAADCPPPHSDVPHLSGVLHRTMQYPDVRAGEAFEAWAEAEKAAGRYASDSFLLDTTQASIIGRETFFIQGDPRELPDEDGRGETRLLCALNSLRVGKERWPLLGMPDPPADRPDRTPEGEWRDTFGPLWMKFGDAGCVFFLLDDAGAVSWDTACY